MVKKFLRTDHNRFSRLGRNRRKKQVWRAAKGRHNKIREKRKSYPKAPNIGYKKPKADLENVGNQGPKLIRNLKDLEKLKSGSTAIVGKIGAKKRIEIVKNAIQKKINILNVREIKK